MKKPTPKIKPTKAPTKNKEQNKSEGLRINKYLALHGYSTRRGADDLISKNQIFINGRRAVLGDKVTDKDKVELRGGQVKKEFRYFAYNKPYGVITHSPQFGQKDIAKDLSGNFNMKGVFPIGRLDKSSTGLMILTDDGRVTDRLLNPKHSHEKEYLVTTKLKLRNNFKEKMEAGVNIEGYKTEKCKVRIIDDFTFRVTLTEGKKHQIRRMCSALFNDVDTLKRERIMNVTLGDLPSGHFRQLQGEELKTFLSSIGL